MKLGKLIVLLLGLAIVAYAVKVELAGTATGTPGHVGAKRQLDNVRVRGKELEKEMQQGAEKMIEQSDQNR